MPRYNTMQSMLIDKYLPADYSDICSRTIGAAKPNTVDALLDSIFCNFPWPIRMLLKLRDVLVKPLGLNTGAKFSDRIMERDDEEIIIGAIDKHLSFWVSVYCSLPADGKQTVSARTLVSFNNFIGKIYFSAIWIFHKMMANMLIKRALNDN